MVCKKCEKKLAKLACPDKWKEGSTNATVGKGRSLAENKLAKKAARYNPYGSKCELCKSTLHQQGKYCHSCAYAKGLCTMCGKQVLDTTSYKQSQQ